jgi:parallel beta-helix repeat protein
VILSLPCNVIVPKRLRAAAWASFIALALALAVADVGAETYYVDNQSPTSSPSGPGTAAQPYSTIAGAVAAHKGAGVTIVVRPGVYREQITIPASGTEGAPYVIRAEGPGVILEGADDFTDEALWVQAGSIRSPGAPNLKAVDAPWVAQDVTWRPRQVFVNGRRLEASTDTPEQLTVDAFTWVEGEGLYVNLGARSPGTEQILVGRRTHGFRMSEKSWVTIDGFELRRIDGTAINLHVGCTDGVVARNRITLSSSYGIKCAGGTRVTIEGNSVSGSMLHGIGLTTGATDCVVRDNESFRNVDPIIRRSNGIHLFGAPGNTVMGNRLYENQDSGVQINAGSNDCLLYNNRSWNNGDHGYDHLDVTGTTHVHNVAYGNYKDGFSIEGDSPGSRIYNSIAANNGLTTDRFNLWVNEASAVGFTSGYNILWNATVQEPVKFVTTKYDLVSDYVAVSGQDAHSMQADPLFVNAPGGDFTPLWGSPAIDAGTSNAPGWPAGDFLGRPRFDDPGTPDAGDGPVSYADIGAVEYVDPAFEDTIELPSPVPPGDRSAAIQASRASSSEGRLSLSTGYPNPSRGSVEFALDLPREAQVEWTVYDLQGRAVWSEGRTVAAGRAQLRWDGTATTGQPAATGIYLVRARVDGTQFTRRVIRL